MKGNNIQWQGKGEGKAGKQRGVRGRAKRGKRGSKAG